MEDTTHQEESVPPDEQGLPFLPDDVLLQVFEYLSVPELFAARTVCRRWAALALHKDVWLRREVSDSEMGVLKAALSLAPCVKEIAITSPSGRVGAFEGCGVLVATTRCAAESLTINTYVHDALAAALVLKNQASLGRLRGLRIRLLVDRDGSSPCEKWRELIRVVCATDHLTKLRLTVEDGNPLPASWWTAEHPERPTTPSLKRLVCKFTCMSWYPMLLHLVYSHADTLEGLHLFCLSDMRRRGVLDNVPWVDSLAMVGGGLRELGCPLLPKMAVLLAGRDSLAHLNLWLDTALNDSPSLAGAQQYLQTATQLRRLTINVKHSDESVRRYSRKRVRVALAPAVSLVVALATSRRSALQVLAFNLRCWDNETVDDSPLPQLATAIGQLDALREVRVRVEDSYALLRVMGHLSGAIRGRTLTLHVTAPRGCCMHEWVHQCARQMGAVFRGCPSLHLEVDSKSTQTPIHHRYYCHEDVCTACVLRCHGHGGKTRVALYGHPEDAACDSPLHADRNVACHRIGH